MSITPYDLSIPAFQRGFAVLSKLLDKAEAFAEERKIKPEILVNARLAPDMLPLAGQIQRMSDTAKGAAARLTGTEAPSFADDETTLADLRVRIANTVSYLATVPESAFKGAAERTVVVKTRGGETSYAGKDYLLTFALPNFYFHLTTAYAILRHNGVPVGKLDYLGRT
ncbi:MULTISPECIES: DUF1993 domain-containing protein [unclassified Shinella]|uniref:DUF1993 domain-containing protein n=1 Tax=unclassified Shinella TaxID=2643062 RepID=UPI00225CDEB2|nr:MULTISPECIES: DUF1993 domain-containing protein [unclassified Shinella]MCO5139380.1 DUF1993 domain-containing protein [Shinella sp.]MDC7255892.1 DUF1993 domain-containing protein [Shinella sp. YE25]CAI0338724.1 conserved hypothetical protein [Rhizobiaceae bacterium]CAK7257157.1 DUF1993 domain-containing protein [Shinella sp. WSC3-e]